MDSGTGLESEHSQDVSLNPISSSKYGDLDFNTHREVRREGRRRLKRFSGV